MPYWTPICNHLIAQSLWKKKGPHWRRLLDTPAFILNGHFLDTKSAIKRATRLKMEQKLFVGMRICFAVILSYFDAGFEERCAQKDFTCVCLLLLLLAAAAAAAAKMCCSPWTLTRVIKPRRGKPSSVKMVTYTQIVGNYKSVLKAPPSS